MHCGSSAGHSRLNELTTQEALSICEQLNELNAKSINLTGGEPILRKDWFTIGTRIRDLGMKLCLLSNGYALNRKIISQLRQLDIYGISISLDGGYSKIHDSIRGISGSFRRCIKCIDMARDAELPTTIITTVNKINLKDLPRIREIIIDKGVAWQIQIAVPIGRFSKSFMLSKDEFYTVALFIASTRSQYSLKKIEIMGAHSIGYHSQILRNTMVSPIWNGCQAGITVLGIQSNGNIKGCLSLPNQYIEGNIRNQSLKEIWINQNSFSYTRGFKSRDLKNQCHNCKFGKT
jgi:radical SAM protein with 4Fe4S-binding SPASM domain